MDSGPAPRGASRNDDGGWSPALALQLPPVRPIIRLIDREFCHRGLPKMLRETRRLQVDLSRCNTLCERTIEFAERTLGAQKLHQPRGFGGIAALLQGQLARHQVE